MPYENPYDHDPYDDEDDGGAWCPCGNTATEACSTCYGPICTDCESDGAGMCLECTGEMQEER